MNKEDLENIKTKYHEIKAKKEKFEKLLAQKMKLENNPKVREYLEILKEVGNLNYYPVKTELDIVDLTIDNVTINSPSNIYVYYGTYSEDYNNNPFLIEKDSPYAKYRTYANIEKPFDVALKDVPITWSAEFEKRNIVLYPENEKDFKEYYQHIKLLFFYTAIIFGKESALELINSELIDRQNDKK